MRPKIVALGVNSLTVLVDGMCGWNVSRLDMPILFVHLIPLCHS